MTDSPIDWSCSKKVFIVWIWVFPFVSFIPPWWIHTQRCFYFWLREELRECLRTKLLNTWVLVRSSAVLIFNYGDRRMDLGDGFLSCERLYFVRWPSKRSIQGFKWSQNWEMSRGIGVEGDFCNLNKFLSQCLNPWLLLCKYHNVN